MVEARVFKVENGGKLKARASVTLEGKWAVTGIRVYEGDNGAFIAMPTGPKYQDKDGSDKYPEYFHPITKEAREELQKAVLDAYNALDA